MLTPDGKVIREAKLDGRAKSDELTPFVKSLVGSFKAPKSFEPFFHDLLKMLLISCGIWNC